MLILFFYLIQFLTDTSIQWRDLNVRIARSDKSRYYSKEPSKNNQSPLCARLLFLYYFFCSHYNYMLFFSGQIEFFTLQKTSNNPQKTDRRRPKLCRLQSYKDFLYPVHTPYELKQPLSEAAFKRSASKIYGEKLFSGARGHRKKGIWKKTKASRWWSIVNNPSIVQEFLYPATLRHTMAIA